MDDEIPYQGGSHARFLMKFLQSRLQRDVRIWVNLMFILISLQTEIARSVKFMQTSIFWCTALGLCISGHDAAEVYSPEGHRHAEANPTCEVHRPSHVIPKFETKILRSDIFAKVKHHERSPNAQKFEDR